MYVHVLISNGENKILGQLLVGASCTIIQKVLSHFTAFFEVLTVLKFL
jgi:hypothetical protein